MLTTTMVNGKNLMKDPQLLTLDEEAVFVKAKELADQVWKRYRENLK